MENLLCIFLGPEAVHDMTTHPHILVMHAAAPESCMHARHITYLSIVIIVMYLSIVIIQQGGAGYACRE